MMTFRGVLPLLFLFGVVLSASARESYAESLTGEKEKERFRVLREAMVRDQIEEPADYREPVRDKRVLEAMRMVPRHFFVPEGNVRQAYQDRPIPIGYGQTISQPYIVALMTAMLRILPEHRVLEVGTGSGYQAAILSVLAREVYTVEIIRALGEKAAERLKRLGYGKVGVKIGDGYYGWKEHAPYDAIIVTCAATLIPNPLIRQLRPGGRMCIPVGARYSIQSLTLIEKTMTGKVTMRKTLPVRFVPLTRDIR